VFLFKLNCEVVRSVAMYVLQKHTQMNIYNWCNLCGSLQLDKG